MANIRFVVIAITDRVCAGLTQACRKVVEAGANRHTVKDVSLQLLLY